MCFSAPVAGLIGFSLGLSHKYIFKMHFTVPLESSQEIFLSMYLCVFLTLVSFLFLELIFQVV